MKLTLLSLAALSSAFVVPDQQVISELEVQSHSQVNNLKGWAQEKVNSIENTLSNVEDDFENAFHAAKGCAHGAAQRLSDEAEDSSRWAQAWVDSASSYLDRGVQKTKESLLGLFEDPHHPHHPPKHPHRPPPHHHKPNLTVYELIASSKYTTKLAKLVNEFPDIVKALNSTDSGNLTVFAPIDKAFEKIPEDAPKPPKEFLEAVLAYHVVPGLFPAGRVLKTSTLPTLLQGGHLSDDPEKTPQRLALNVGFRGLTVNFIPRIIAVDIFGTNGVIHGLDSILIPPPKVAKIIQLVPSAFSTLELALYKSEGFAHLNDTSNHLGGTLFAPDNRAFERLGPRANAFLFSPYGKKYLAALLMYHYAPNVTLYNDYLYKSYHGEDSEEMNDSRPFHIDLPTLLPNKSLSIDIGAFAGGFIKVFKINGFSTVKTPNGVARDGVLHVVSSVLIPPKTGATAETYNGGEISVEELKERLQPLL